MMARTQGACFPIFLQITGSESRCHHKTTNFLFTSFLPVGQIILNLVLSERCTKLRLWLVVAASWFGDLQVIRDVPEASGMFSRLKGCYCSLFDPFIFLTFVYETFLFSCNQKL